MKRRARRVRYGKPPEIVGVDQIKLTVFHALNAIKGQANYCHFPANRSEEYFLQLSGERLIVQTSKNRRPERHWVPIHSAVEALDCRVYAYAALLLSRADLSQPAKAAEAAPPPATPPVKAMPPPPRAKPPRGHGLAPDGWSL
jgi:phage terminase large subunit GpA-like protein